MTSSYPHPPVTAVKYHGFINMDLPDGRLPSAAAVDKAAKLLKSGQKVAREIHPLFARGLDTPLDLSVRHTWLHVLCARLNCNDDSIQEYKEN